MEEDGEMQFPAFPHKPYSIQIDFMKALYQSLQKGGIAMLESPTGTGKTLSIICSALQWLVDKRQQNLDPAKDGSDSNQNLKDEDPPGSDGEPDWMRKFTVNKESESPQDRKTKIKNFRSKKWNKKGKEECSTIRDIFNRTGVGGDEDVDEREVKASKLKSGIEEVEDHEFLVEDYESEGEDGVKLKKRGGGGYSVDSSSEEDGQEDGFDEKEQDSRPKIYFCSRTHSQLSQFIKELRKTKFASELKVVSLGSRKNFCINEEVLRLGNTTSINERCLELQKAKSKRASKMMNLSAGKRVRRMKASSGCPMLQSRKAEREFWSETSHQGPLDIEDLVKVGHKVGTCPYYGSRSMVPTADLVILPYQSLLSKTSRESLNLSLKNNIIIIDEAHNLADSLISMYDVKITSSQLERIHSHLEKYLERFQNLLGPGNQRYIQTLMVLTHAFLQSVAYPNGANYVDPLSSGGEVQSDLDFSIGINEFLFSLNIDNINLVKLLHYIEESNIIHKVSGFGDKLAMLQNDVELEGTTAEASTLSGFRALVSLLSSLTNNDGDGRIIISRARVISSVHERGYLKYVMLTGEKIFSEVASEAHAIILAGGTLQPIEEIKERLFPWLQPDQLHFFSCGHIIPPTNILPVAVSQGPSGQSFDFSYSGRSSSSMAKLGMLLCNLVAVVPEGIVVFFSSFDYEGKVYEAWKESGILARIMKKKHLFREPRKNTDVELVLKEYKETIDELSITNAKYDPAPCSGAVLLAVVGGKISEGINLSDGMGRCIVMVGLPYPSPSDMELMERVKYIEGLESSLISKTQARLDILKCCKHRGRQYYENICMKAVNQSIGAAIRHINDYAAILLVDARYASDPSRRSFSHVCDKLPQWIRSHLIPSPKNYGAVHRLLHQFFKFHRKETSNR
ncbi:unnamed protein product [Coffea canephora]|uniref:Helicase ATP-binding domain-containing protein n=1 Tax=Coffea canephora TaxID=49390 RepID=A0A068TRP8_COFCA|nr:unnamed protein product [Coffea canephora]